MVRLPRLVIAAPASGHGKTTVATGLIAALARSGLTVAPAKVGPDYIDPGYHTLAAGRPGRNLDPFLTSEDLIAPLLLHGARTPTPADIAVIEGVMGLFDGRLGTGGFASTAHVARLTDSPVVLVVDVRHTSRSIGALVHGLATFEPGLRVAGVVLNQVGSPRHEAEVRDAVARTGVPVVGVLPKAADIEAPSRHLGLVPAAERPESAAALDSLAELIAEHVDLDAVRAIAASAPDLDAEPWEPSAVVRPPSGAGDGRRPVIAVAGGRAFTFLYPETLELLRAAGCEPVSFDPMTDAALPPGTAGIYLGGGFPEMYPLELAGNAALRADLARAIAAGTPTVAECAGLLYLSRAVDGHPMVGALDVEAAMTPRLTLGYREAVAPADTFLAAAGTRVTGHEFHRTALLPQPDAGAWDVGGRPDGLASGTVHAAYLHVHWAGYPALAERFAAAAHTFLSDRIHTLRGTTSHTPGDSPALHADLPAPRVDASAPPAPAVSPVSPAPPDSPLSPDDAPSDADLAHHGDADLAPGLTDLAVNVLVPAPPSWLVDVIVRTSDAWSAYPDPRAAVAAIAARHGVPDDMVLPTAGGTEAFALVGRVIPGRRPLVVHPQFTLAEAAFTAAGRRPARHLLTAPGFTLDPQAVPADADLVSVGNPTNPTGVLHPAAALQALRRPGRTLVVDEAFADATPDAPSLIGPDMDGVLVLRSLTKVWGLAGVRAGYVVGDPALVARLREAQEPWSVSTPALAAMVACASPDAVAEADALARRVAAARPALVAGLEGLGLPVVPGDAPFVCFDTASLGPESLRVALAERGFAVRRGETFPGLGPTWLRVAVRDPETSAAFVAALADLAGGRVPEPAQQKGLR